jgi:kynurenine formamidase
MAYFDLSMTLNHEWMPDQVFPLATPFFLGPKDHPDKGMIVGQETGTCITLPAQFAEFRKTRRLDDIPLDELFLRAAVTLDIPKQDGGEIGADEVAAALDCAEPQARDAILIRTGWGDTGMDARPGPQYMLRSPYFSLGAAHLLASKMKSVNSNLLLADTAFFGRPGSHLIPEWCSLQPLPRPWPSREAQVYLHLYTPAKTKADFAVDLVFAQAGVMTVKKLIGCGALGRERTQIIVSPLRIIRGVASTCRVLAVQ